MYYNHHYDDIQQWYVVFHRRVRPRHRLFHWLLRNDFVHCYLAKEAPANSTLIVDAWPWGLAIHHEEKPIDAFLLDEAKIATAVLGFTADYRRQTVPRYRGMFTCVSLIKSVLGLHKCALVQTPYGLYRRLLKYDLTTVIKPYSPYMRIAENV